MKSDILSLVKEKNESDQSSKEEKELEPLTEVGELVVDEELAPAKEEKIVHHAIESFEKANLDPRVMEMIKNMGWNNPTPIQAMCLPYILKGQDLAGFAQTGTGKTGVFLISLAQKIIHKKPQESGILALVLVPTRELTIQIADECKKFFQPLSNFKTLAIYGGEAWEEQAKNLKEGVDIVIATPGRLKDFYEKKLLHLNSVETFVCDEVDRMFDMGFIDDVEYFLAALPKEKLQVLLFSATSNERVKELAFEYLNNPEYVSVSPEEITPDTIEQHAIHCKIEDKFKILLNLIKREKDQKSIIFANTKLTAAWLHYKLLGNDLKADVITGDLPQQKRSLLIQRLKTADSLILIATDVASRGLHISGITHVYNFDVPDEAVNYVHRIGRTARAGTKGKSYTLVCEEYGENFEKVQDLLGKRAPTTQWIDASMLSIEDKSGIAFRLDDGRVVIKSFHDKKREEAAQQQRRQQQDRRPQDRRPDFRQQRPRHKSDQRPNQQRHQKPTHSQATPKKKSSVWSAIKRFFSLLLGKNKK